MKSIFKNNEIDENIYQLIQLFFTFYNNRIQKKWKTIINFWYKKLNVEKKKCENIEKKCRYCDIVIDRYWLIDWEKNCLK